MERQVKCFTCANVIGHKYKEFVARRNASLSEEEALKVIEEDHADASEEEKARLLRKYTTSFLSDSDVLTDMNVSRNCCRLSIATAQEVSSRRFHAAGRPYIDESTGKARSENVMTVTGKSVYQEPEDRQNRFEDIDPVIRDTVVKRLVKLKKVPVFKEGFELQKHVIKAFENHKFKVGTEWLYETAENTKRDRFLKAWANTKTSTQDVLEMIPSLTREVGSQLFLQKIEDTKDGITVYVNVGSVKHVINIKFDVEAFYFTQLDENTVDEFKDKEFTDYQKVLQEQFLSDYELVLNNKTDANNDSTSEPEDEEEEEDIMSDSEKRVKHQIFTTRDYYSLHASYVYSSIVAYFNRLRSKKDLIEIYSRIANPYERIFYLMSIFQLSDQASLADVYGTDLKIDVVEENVITARSPFRNPDRILPPKQVRNLISMATNRKIVYDIQEPQVIFLDNDKKNEGIKISGTIIQSVKDISDDAKIVSSGYSQDILFLETEDSNTILISGDIAINDVAI